jgi:hypothetical protein
LGWGVQQSGPRAWGVKREVGRGVTGMLEVRRGGPGEPGRVGTGGPGEADWGQEEAGWGRRAG